MRALLLLLLPLTAAASGPPEAGPLLDRAGVYVLDYGKSFRNVLAEETYKQTLWLRTLDPSDYSYEPGAPKVQILRSDIVWVPLPGSIPWGSFRDTLEIDGRSLRDRDARLEQLFSRPHADRLKQAEALLYESARHNLGKTYRNYNLPLIALLFLLPQNQPRFQFRLRGESRVGRTPVVELDYEETSIPTIIRDLADQGDLKTRGRFWIEAATGRVLRTEMHVHPPGGHGTLRVEFSFVEKLGLLAPREMHDHFEEKSSILRGTAEYRNYRRFEAEVGPITYER